MKRVRQMNTQFLVHNGKPYLRVSSIISALRGGFGDVPQAVLEAKAKIGIEVHEICQKLLLGEIQTSTNERVMNYVNSFRHFNRIGLLQKPLICEERFFDDELGVTGQVDLVCPVKGSRNPILIDLKTSAQAEGYLWLIQGTLYAKMISQTYPEINLADTFLFLQLKEKGSAKAIRFENWKTKLSYVEDIVSTFMNSNKEKLEEIFSQQECGGLHDQ